MKTWTPERLEKYLKKILPRDYWFVKGGRGSKFKVYLLGFSIQVEARLVGPRDRRVPEFTVYNGGGSFATRANLEDAFKAFIEALALELDSAKKLIQRLQF